jgi:hypothetical protein
MTRDEAFSYALGLPGAEESVLFGGRCVRVRGKSILNESREAGVLSLSLDVETIAFLMETEPQTYFQTPHFRGYPAVLVRPEPADETRLKKQIEAAWARRASKAQKAARIGLV